VLKFDAMSRRAVEQETPGWRGSRRKRWERCALPCESSVLHLPTPQLLTCSELQCFALKPEWEPREAREAISGRPCASGATHHNQTVEVREKNASAREAVGGALAEPTLSLEN
jgi:hypothetical protein